MVYERILIDQNQLNSCVDRLAAEVAAFYAGKSFLALTLLEGARPFTRDLLQKINTPFEQAFVRISSYCGSVSAGAPAIAFPEGLEHILPGKDILVIDDIYDTGRTLSMLLRHLEILHPRSIKTCVLLEKNIDHSETVTIDFLGRHVPDVFVIGYGLDYNGRYRDLPFIAELASEYIEE